MNKKTVNVKITNDLKGPSTAGTHYRLICITGPNKGKIYYLTGARIIIGRGENADIQIVDVKISREHAELSFSNNGYIITDLGAENGVVVNDSKVKQKRLENSEKIVIGLTVFKYSVIEINKYDLILSEKKEGVNSFGGPKESKFENIEHIEKKEKKSGAKLITVALIVGGVGFLFMEESITTNKLKSKAGKRNEDFDIILPATKKISETDVESLKKFKIYLHSGRREFSEGNYFRAMEDFRLALLIDPKNKDASFYQSKAKQKLDEDIGKNFMKGRQEYEAKKFQAAKSSYCGVLQLIQNYPEDERYKDAVLKLSAIESELGLEKGEIKCFEEKSADPKN